MDKKLEMHCKIEAVFEHYAEQSEYYWRANVAQRIVMKDRFYWLTMKLLSKIIGPFEGMEPERLTHSTGAQSGRLYGVSQRAEEETHGRARCIKFRGFALKSPGPSLFTAYSQ